MADDRMFIRCKCCGEVRLIAKQWGGIYRPCDDVEERLTSFFVDHAGCFPSAKDSFEVVYENSFEGKIVNTEDGEYWNPPD